MPIPRELAKKTTDVFARLLEFATEEVRTVQIPLTDNGWKQYIIKKLEVDEDISERLFKELIEKGVLIHTRILHKKPLYISDTTPDFKRYMWTSDLIYE